MGKKGRCSWAQHSLIRFNISLTAKDSLKNQTVYCKATFPLLSLSFNQMPGCAIHFNKVVAIIRR